MAQALQHDQAALILELSTTRTGDINPGNSSGSERSYAVVSIPLVQNIRQVRFFCGGAVGDPRRLQNPANSGPFETETVIFSKKHTGWLARQ